MTSFAPDSATYRAVAALRSFSAMVLSVCAIMRYDRPRRARITVTRVAMIRADPCSPASRADSFAHTDSLPLIMMALLGARAAGRHGNRLGRADAERAHARQTGRVGEVVLQGDRLAGHRGGPHVPR